MAALESAKYYLKPLAIDFANDKLVDEKELAKNRNWKKLIRLPTSQRYEPVLIAWRGLLQKRNPGFDNNLWAMIIGHELGYMLTKGNKQFLYEAAEELKKVRDINTLPFPIGLKVIRSLKRHGFDSCLYILLESLLKKHTAINSPSKDLQEFISELAENFENITKSSSEELQKEVYHLHGSFNLAAESAAPTKWGKYFIDTQEEEEAWHRLDNNTIALVQKYEEAIFNDRAPKPSQQQKKQTIKAVENSNLNCKHKKALIESIKKKG